jgi:hypothetical protein
VAHHSLLAGWDSAFPLLTSHKHCAAQVGDAAPYSVFGEQPEERGRIWTSAREDPSFRDGSRAAFVLDPQHVGTDTLAASAAALASAALVFRETDPA